VLPGEIADAEERCRGRRLESTLPGSRCGRARGSLARQNPSAAVACTCSPLAVVARARAAPGRAHAAGRGGGASRFRDALLELPRGRAMRRQVALLAPPRSRRPPSRASCRRSVLLGRPAPAVRARAPTINLAHPILCRYVRI
jgi:hypothetical protein